MYDTISSSQHAPVQTFDEKLFAIHQTNDLAQLVSFAQLCIRTIFHECLPAIGFEPSGIRLNAFSRRLLWNVRYESQLGTLNSFINAFEDLFFVIKRTVSVRTRSSINNNNLFVNFDDGNNTVNGEGNDLTNYSRGDIDIQIKKKKKKRNK